LGFRDPVLQEVHRGVQGAGVKGRAVLQGIERMLDADGFDALFGGSSDQAGVLYALLRDCARGESALCYEEIRRVAERRGVTPRYIVDRAEVLLASAEDRCSGDLYRILGVSPLAGADEIRARWREVVKECHPDHGGGDPNRFREIKAAYDVLRDPAQRAEYEQAWEATVSPIERARAAAATRLTTGRPPRASGMLRASLARLAQALRAPGPIPVGARPADAPAADLSGAAAAATASNGERPGEPPGETGAVAAEDGRGPYEQVLAAAAAGTNGDGAPDVTSPTRIDAEEGTMQDVLVRTGAMVEAVQDIDRRLAGAGVQGVGAVGELYERLDAALAAVRLEEIDATLADIERATRALAAMGRDLGRLRHLKLALGGAAAGAAAAAR
jgi:DnaJ-domain-containing protein 1